MRELDTRMNYGKEYVCVEEVSVCLVGGADIRELQGEGGYLFHGF